MEHHIRPMLTEYRFHARRILDVADHALHRLPGELLLDAVQRQLRLLEEDQATRCETGDLPAQLRTDRASRTGHQHHLAIQQPVQAGLIERDAVTAEEVFQLNLADTRNRHAAGEQVAQRGYGQHLHPCRDRQFRGMATGCRARLRHGDHGVTHLRAPDMEGKVGHRPQHGDAGDLPPQHGGILRQQADHAPLAPRRQFAQQRSRGLAAAEDQQGFSRQLTE